MELAPIHPHGCPDESRLRSRSALPPATRTFLRRRRTQAHPRPRFCASAAWPRILFRHLFKNAEGTVVALDLCWSLAMAPGVYQCVWLRTRFCFYRHRQRSTPEYLQRNTSAGGRKSGSALFGEPWTGEHSNPAGAGSQSKVSRAGVLQQRPGDSGFDYHCPGDTRGARIWRGCLRSTPGWLICRAAPLQPNWRPWVLYVVGMGATTPTVPTGQASTGSPLANVALAPTMTLDGESVTPFFAGLTPGFVGLYQINFIVPSDARTGR